MYFVAVARAYTFRYRITAPNSHSLQRNTEVNDGDGKHVIDFGNFTLD